MRKLWPFFGIALAVAGGVAIAPYFWWVAAVGACTALGYGAWLGRQWLTYTAGTILLAAMLYWPVWLFLRGQPADAAFVIGVYLLVALVGERRIRAATRRIENPPAPPLP